MNWKEHICDCTLIMLNKSIVINSHKAKDGEVQKFLPPVGIPHPQLERENNTTRRIERKGKKKSEVNSLSMVHKNALLLEETTQRRWLWK